MVEDICRYVALHFKSICHYVSSLDNSIWRYIISCEDSNTVIGGDISHNIYVAANSNIL